LALPEGVCQPEFVKRNMTTISHVERKKKRRGGGKELFLSGKRTEGEKRTTQEWIESIKINSKSKRREFSSWDCFEGGERKGTLQKDN